MGNKYILSGAVLLLAACLLSCEKSQVRDRLYSSEEIMLDAAPWATKGMLNSDSLTVGGTQFQMYDYLSGYNGTISGHSDGAEFQYFTNTLTYNPDATSWKWVFGNVSSPDHYRWTRTGTHHFFGWLLADGHDATTLNTASLLSSNSFATSFDEETKQVKFSNEEITITSPQYDFLYSNVISVPVADGVPEKVAIPLHHLFGAVGVTISNNSDLDVIVYGVSFQNFPTKNTVTLDYSGFSADSCLVYSQPTCKSGVVFFPNQFRNNEEIELHNRDHATLAGKVYDAITRNDITNSTPDYYMAWPVLRSTLEPVGTTYDNDGNPVYASNAPVIVVDCKIGTQDRKTYKFKFPTNSETPWFIQAGKKTTLALQILNKQIGLSFTITPWHFEKYPMSYEDDAISATQLKFTLNTYTGGDTERINGVKHTVIKLTSSSQAGSYIATRTFKVFTPVNGTLTVGLGGNADDFLATLQSGDATYGGTESITINPNRDGGKITLSIRPVGTPAHGSRCFLHFGVRNNGRDSEADSEINRDAYIVEFP